MVTQTKVNWSGLSGKAYTYEAHPVNTSWNNVPGNYIFAKQTASGWVALYIGETGNLKNRLSGHEKYPCAVNNGITHILAHVSSNIEAVRKAEEIDLINRWNPPCNGQSSL